MSSAAMAFWALLTHPWDREVWTGRGGTRRPPGTGPAGTALV